MDHFVESVDSTYGCVVLRGRGIVTATKNFWSLHCDEINLLLLQIAALNGDPWAQIKDTPVFLPVKSPTVPFRLIAAELIVGVVVLVLCGPAPSLSEIEVNIKLKLQGVTNILIRNANLADAHCNYQN